MPYSSAPSDFVPLKLAAAVLGLVVLSAGAFFSLQAPSNNNVVIQNDKTADGRSIYTRTSSGATTQSGANTVVLPTFANNEPETAEAPYSIFDAIRGVGTHSGSFIDGIIWNKSNFNATADLVLLAGIGGSDTTNFMDVGFTSPTYNVLGGAAQLIGPREGYVYVPSGSMSIGTDTSTGAVKFFVAGITGPSIQNNNPASDERMRITQSGAEIGTKTGNAQLAISGSFVIGKNVDPKVKAKADLAVRGAMSGRTLIATNLPAEGSSQNAMCVTAQGVVQFNATTTCLVSSARFKHDITPLTQNATQQIMSMRPVSYLDNGNNEENVGLIAEEMDQIEPRLVFYEKNGMTPRGIKYENLTAILVKSIQELNARIEVLEKERCTGCPCR